MNTDKQLMTLTRILFWFGILIFLLTAIIYDETTITECSILVFWGAFAVSLPILYWLLNKKTN
jgi:uncharacterized membrane protein YhhN